MANLADLHLLLLQYVFTRHTENILDLISVVLCLMKEKGVAFTVR